MTLPKPNPRRPRKAEAAPPGGAGGTVCVSIRRGEHFWRFACDAQGVRELFERLAELADEGSPLAWEDAELVAAHILSSHSNDRGEPAPAHDR